MKMAEIVILEYMDCKTKHKPLNIHVKLIGRDSLSIPESMILYRILDDEPKAEAIVIDCIC